MKACANDKCPHGKIFAVPGKNFNKDRSRKDGFTPYCKKCSRDNFKFYYKNVKTSTVLCAYSKCSIQFSTARENQKYCCSEHQKLAYYEKQEKVGLFSRQNVLRKKKRLDSYVLAKNSAKNWKEKDISDATYMRIDGKTWNFIAKKLGRTESSVAQKILPLVKKLKEKAKGKIIY